MSAQRHRIVFLYSELAGYFLACAEALGQHPEVNTVDIVHWPMHPEAPFQFSSTNHYTLHPKAKHNRESLKELLAQINPTALVCSGWMDSDYNALAKAHCNRIPVVLTLDNWWTGSLKQRLAVLTAPWFIKRRFNRAWVPSGRPKSPSPKNWASLEASSLQDFTAPTQGPFKPSTSAESPPQPRNSFTWDAT